jgi:hypothetical protein
MSAGWRQPRPEIARPAARRGLPYAFGLCWEGTGLPSGQHKEVRMPDHIKLILRHALYGFFIALGFVAMLLYFNVANLWHLVTHTAEGPIAVLMLVVFCTITFGSVQIGFKIMSMGEDDDDTDQGGKRDALPMLERVAIPVRVDDRRH